MGRHRPSASLGTTLASSPGEPVGAHSMFILTPLRPLVGQQDVIEALALLAVDPGLGGAVIIGEPGSGRRAAASLLQLLLPDGAPFVAAGAGDDAILHDHLDWEATLKAGRPVTRPGLWRRAAGGVLFLSRGEDMDTRAAAQLAAALRRPGAPRLLISAQAAEFSIEGNAVASEAPSLHLSRGLGSLSPLGPRLAFWLTLEPLAGAAEREALLEASVSRADPALLSPPAPNLASWRGAVAEASRRLPRVAGHPALMERLCRETARFGSVPPAVDILVWRAARARAALHGRDRITAADIARAVELIVAPRSSGLPSEQGLSSEEARGATEERVRRPSPEAAGPSSAREPAHTLEQREHEGQQTGGWIGSSRPPSPRPDGSFAASRRGREVAPPLPPELLPVYDAVQEQRHRRLAARLSRPFSRPEPRAVPASRHSQSTSAPKGRPVAARATAAKRSPLGGRPTASPHAPHGPIAWAPTIHAALPWQRLRPRRPGLAVSVAPEDIRRREPRLPQTALYIVVIDTSGSMGAARTRAAKGLVQALLQRAYTGRSEVCLIQGGGSQARIIVPPTRSLRRAREALNVMATGGATPLADALRLAGDVAEKRRRRGDGGPIAVVVLSDGRGNVPGPLSQRHGLSPEEEIAALARRLHRCGASAVVLDRDGAGRPAEDARTLARLMQAPFLPL